MTTLSRRLDQLEKKMPEHDPRAAGVLLAQWLSYDGQGPEPPLPPPSDDVAFWGVRSPLRDVIWGLVGLWRKEGTQSDKRVDASESG